MRKVWKLLRIAVVAALAIGAIGFVVMSLWNWLAPVAFGGHLIGFWQAIGLFVLARVLVGGLRRGGGHRHWRHRMGERWSRMSDEERARFGRGCGRYRDDARGSEEGHAA
ncbi:MAG: hypothetical protein ABI460_03060 [Caldimonas sp.]